MLQAFYTISENISHLKMKFKLLFCFCKDLMKYNIYIVGNYIIFSNKHKLAFKEVNTIFLPYFFSLITPSKRIKLLFFARPHPRYLEEGVHANSFKFLSKFSQYRSFGETKPIQRTCSGSHLHTMCQCVVYTLSHSLRIT